MKTRKTRATLLTTALLAVLVACGTTETEYITAPSLFFSTGIVSAPDDGGQVTATYTVKNPITGGEVTASASASWITDINCSAFGVVTFTASANSSGNPRTANVILTYSYSSGGAGGAVSADLTVAQSCGDQPVLSIQPTAVTAGIEGGLYSFSYTIVNPVSDGELTASSTAGWLSDFNTSTSGTVSFNVAENDGGNMRSAEISVVYTHGNGTATESVTVVQDHASGNSEDEDVDLSGFVGTYLCDGIMYNKDYGGIGDAGVEDTWTMKIYDHGDGRLLLSGLVAGTVDNYYPGLDFEAGDDSGPMTAFAKVSGDDIIISYPQFTGEMYNGYYYTWIACLGYSDGSDGERTGFQVGYGSGNVTCVYDSSTGVWTTDCGLILGLCSTKSPSSFLGLFVDMFAPGMTFYKTSNTTETANAGPSHESVEEVTLHSGGAMPFKD